MGVQVAVARLGTAAALVFSPMIVKHFSLSAPLLFSAVLLCIGLLAYLVFCGMDKKFDAEVALENGEADDIFKVKDLKLIIPI